MRILVLALCCLACQQDRQSPSALDTRVRDSAGIRIVENSRPPDGSRLAWTIGPEPAVSIGVFDGQEPYMLYGALDGTRLPDGRIVVANRGTGELRVFDGDGQYLATWGREGEGPTDFASLVKVEKWPGDSIMAWYTGAMGMAVYDSAGEFGRTFVLQSGAGVPWRRPRPLAAHQDGTILAVKAPEDADTAVVEVWDGEGALSASLGTHDAAEVIVTTNERGSKYLSWKAVVEQARQEFETTPFADYFPAFSSVIGDALGHLWVEEYKYPREDRGGTLWTVFDPEGHALGFVETPEGLEVYEIGEDYILGRVRDELDIESIQLWALERSD